MRAQVKVTSLPEVTMAVGGDKNVVSLVTTSSLTCLLSVLLAAVTTQSRMPENEIQI